MDVHVSTCVLESFDLGLVELDGLIDWLNGLQLDAVVTVVVNRLHGYSLHAFSQSSLVASSSLRADLHKEDDHCKTDQHWQDQPTIESHPFFLLIFS